MDLALPRAAARPRRRFRLPPGGRRVLAWIGLILVVLAWNVGAFVSNPNVLDLMGAVMLALSARASVLQLLTYDHERGRPVGFERVRRAHFEAMAVWVAYPALYVLSFFLPIG